MRVAVDVVAFFGNYANVTIVNELYLAKRLIIFNKVETLR